jgi:hypothetical protein
MSNIFPSLHVYFFGLARLPGILYFHVSNISAELLIKIRNILCLGCLGNHLVAAISCEGKSHPFSWWGKKIEQVAEKVGMMGQVDGEA